MIDKSYFAPSQFLFFNLLWRAAEEKVRVLGAVN